MEVKCEICRKYFVSRSEEAKCCGRYCYAVRRERINQKRRDLAWQIDLPMMCV